LDGFVVSNLMKIATWNINSVRLREEMVLQFLQAHAPDVLCLQETKTVDDSFPRRHFKDLGYSHQHINGMKSYNGVAILSKIPFAETGILSPCGKQDCRHIFATLANGVTVHTVYIPAGGDIPDRTVNDKFGHKLDFLDHLRDWSLTAPPKTVLVGDFNIAPEEHDVWSHKQMQDVVSHTPIEIEKLAALQATRGWVDTARHFVPSSQKLYSWWSYRAADWAASDRGRRLDHIWVTPDLAPHLHATETLRVARGWGPKPSDHVPVMTSFAF
jgi:exodeoxyribonuclease III